MTARLDPLGTAATSAAWRRVSFPLLAIAAGAFAIFAWAPMGPPSIAVAPLVGVAVVAAAVLTLLVLQRLRAGDDTAKPVHAGAFVVVVAVAAVVVLVAVAAGAWRRGLVSWSFVGLLTIPVVFWCYQTLRALESAAQRSDKPVYYTARSVRVWRFAVLQVTAIGLAGFLFILWTNLAAGVTLVAFMGVGGVLAGLWASFWSLRALEQYGPRSPGGVS